MIFKGEKCHYLRKFSGSFSDHVNYQEDDNVIDKIDIDNYDDVDNLIRCHLGLTTRWSSPASRWKTMRSSSVRFFKITKTASTIAVHVLVDLLTVPLKNDLKVGAAENSPAIQSQTATVTVEVRSKL